MMKYKRLFKYLLICILLAHPFSIFAENIDPANDGSRYAWGENIGWINFKPSQGPGVTVTSTGLTGYAWGENIGWINLNPLSGGVVNDGAGNLSGYAWGENIGWISFSCQNTNTCGTANYGVFIDPTTGIFSGYAWGENIGWINFAPTGRMIVTSWRAPISVTAQTSPTGLSFTVDGTPYSSPQTFQWSPGSSHTIATTSPQGSDGTGYIFANWSDGGAISHSVTAPSSPTTYTATFDTQYLLTTSVSPSGAGTTSANPSSSDGYYNSGTPVQLTATANSGYQFANWSGDLTGTTNPQSVTMSAPKSITANFSAIVSVTVQTSPTGRSFTVDGNSYTSLQTFQWTPGSSHTIATTSPQGSGGTRYMFNNWSDGGAMTHTVTAPSVPTTYTATFDTQYLLTTSVSPSDAGTTSANPTSSDGYYNSGTPVQLTATANSGYQFANWSGDLTGTTNPQSVTMSAPKSVTANFNYTFAYIFYGFFKPVDNPSIVNKAKAGQAIPVKWRITDTNGVPISDPASFMSLTSYPIDCESLAGDPTDAVKEYTAGSSGVQYLGDGNWQFNWKTPKTYTGQCRTMVLTLADSSTHTAYFSFK
jgi:hypothetical protein